MVYASFRRIIALLQALPEMSLPEIRGMAELLRRALAGTEWEQLQRLVAVRLVVTRLRPYLNAYASHYLA